MVEKTLAMAGPSRARTAMTTTAAAATGKRRFVVVRLFVVLRDLKRFLRVRGQV
jgi:hypothetical protein